MINLWIFFMLLIGATVGILMLPLMRRSGVLSSSPHPDIKIYRDQLTEIDRDIERGLLTSDQAEASSNEIRRRILAVSETTQPQPATGFGRWMAVALIILLIPIGSVTIYRFIGTPDLPDQPYAERVKNDPYFALMSSTMAEAARVSAHPSPQGYKHIGDIYFGLQRYGPAAVAFNKAAELEPNNPANWSSLGESLILMNDGIVVPEATKAFTKAYKLDSRNARAEFYLGAAALESHGARAALAIWRDLEAKSPAQAPWMPMLEQYIKTYSSRDKIDPATVKPEPPDTNSP